MPFIPRQLSGQEGLLASAPSFTDQCTKAW
jgi:hypothetical protein